MIRSTASWIRSVLIISRLMGMNIDSALVLAYRIAEQYEYNGS